MYVCTCIGRSDKSETRKATSKITLTAIGITECTKVGYGLKDEEVNGRSQNLVNYRCLTINFAGNSSVYHINISSLVKLMPTSHLQQDETV